MMIATQDITVHFERGAIDRKVAVIIPLYNYAATIVQALDSVAQQTCHDLVIMVVDDASSDASLATARGWMERYDGPMSLRLLGNSANAGLSATRNAGIAHTTSALCFFLDADNVLFARCIARHVAALDRRPDCAGAYAMIEEFGNTSGVMGNNVFARDRLARGNTIDAMAMVRREWLNRLGGFRPIEHGWEDYDMWLRLCEEGQRLLHIPEILSRYRNHSNSMLRRQTNRKDNLAALCATLRGLHPWIHIDDANPAPRTVGPATANPVTIARKPVAPAPVHDRPADPARDDGALPASGGDVPQRSDSFKTAMIDAGFFDADFYRAQLREHAHLDDDALFDHYLSIGERLGLAPSGHFDPAYYRRLYPDLAEVDGLARHYLRNGALEGRKGSLASDLIAAELDGAAIKARLIPTPAVGRSDRNYANALALALRAIDHDPQYFSRTFYCWRYPDIDPAQVDPLVHYLKFGRHEGRVTNVAMMRRMHRYPERIDPAQPFILIGVHEASATGAPIVGMDLAIEMARDHNVIFVSLKPGKLIERARTVFPVVIEGNYIDEDNAFFIQTILDSYPVADAIFSSSACIPFMRPLSTQPVRITCLVHEFLEYMLHTHGIVYLADLIVFSSHALRKSWQHQLDDLGRSPDTIMVLPQPTASSSTRQMDKAQARAAVAEATGLDLDGATLVLGAGHVQIRKGTDIFLQIGNQLRREQRNNPGEKFVTVWIGEQISELDMVFGVWFHAQLERGRDASGDPGVHFEPAGPLYPVLMDAADVFIVSSRLDPLPNVALDAAVRGMPVIAFAGATGLPDVAARGQIDLIEVEIGAIDEAVAAIKAIHAGRTRPDGPTQPIEGYREYCDTIMATVARVAQRDRLPVNVAIEVDYTGPAHATPFDSFATRTQRETSEKQIARMLESGITAISPQPGIHAARENGDFIRYRSLPVEQAWVDRMPPDMLIHIHAFYPEIVGEILKYFKGDARSGRFFITTTTQSNHEAIGKIVARRGFTNCTIALIDNRGRDIGPFLDHAVDFARPGDVICHIHTKKSPDVGGTYGEKWRRQLYGALLTQTAIDAFADPQLGLLFPDTPRTVGWGKNRAFCAQIAENLGVAMKPHPGPMPVGNMFFARIEVARAMRQATQQFAWPREPVGYDGTILHAIERMWTAACEHAGFAWAAVHSRYRDPVPDAAAHDSDDDED